MTIARESIRRTDFRGVATARRLASVHPGEVLLKQFIEPLGLARYKVAKAIKVQQRRIDEMCAGQRAITEDAALRVAKLFGMDA